MKKTTTKLMSFALLILATSLFISCSKEGAQGPKGDTGAQGQAGLDGNANVKAFQYTVNTSDWTWNSTNFVYYTDIPCTAITTDIMNYGMVVGYKKTGAAGVWSSMPNVSWPNPSLTTTTTFELVYHQLGSFRIRYYWSDYRETPPSSQETFKVLVVSGTGKMTHPGLDWNDYTSVKEAFGLRD